jgi:hypothetical protein
MEASMEKELTAGEKHKVQGSSIRPQSLACGRCGFELKNINQDYEVLVDTGARAHRLEECFRLVNQALTDYWVPEDQRLGVTPEHQTAAFQKGRQSHPLTEAEHAVGKRKKK